MGNNMSYCRFRNTREDIEECIEALENRNIESKEEKYGAKDILKKVLDFCTSEGIIEGYDKDRIQSIIEACE